MDPIPDEIRQFLEGNIESVDQLEILRILGEDPGREWATADLAREAQCRPDDAAAHLAALHGRGLVSRVERGGNVVGRYGPATPDLERRLGLLLAMYRERPVTLIKLVAARANAALRAFADAFRLRKEG